MTERFSSERRRFLGTMSLSVGGIAVASMAPVSLLQAMPQCVVPAVGQSDLCRDWTLDDMCNAYPPYAFHTGAARPHTLPSRPAMADADRHWVT
jgi:hypothetical protein